MMRMLTRMIYIFLLFSVSYFFFGRMEGKAKT
jgi:hypothetical protein